MGICVLMFLGACSTTRITYEVGDDSVVERSEPRITYEVEDVKPAPKPRITYEEREPDIKSEPATVTFDYPERVNPSLYEVTQEVNVRDFPSMEGNIVGTLKVGDRVVGNEIEGTWIRIYDNSYTSLRFLKRIY